MMTGLPRPGLVGRSIRLVLGLLVVWLLWGLLQERQAYWAGFPRTSDALILVALLVVLSSWVVTELTGRPWGQRPLLVLLAGAAVAAVVGTASGDVLGAPLGVYVWAWGVVFSLLLGPAHLLAAVLGTPGCEMRSYADLVTRLRGGDPAAVACPGWIDRFDGVRVFGRW